MLIWPEFWLPPLNLWSYPLYAQMNKKQEREMLEKHKKFKEYWMSIDCPVLECFVDGNWNRYPHEIRPIPNFDAAQGYRITGDKHWELRQKWIDSGFTLSIEGKNSKETSKWLALPESALRQKGTWGLNDPYCTKMYREAIQENLQPVASKEYTAGYKEGLDEAIKKLYELQSKYG